MIYEECYSDQMQEKYKRYGEEIQRKDDWNVLVEFVETHTGPQFHIILMHIRMQSMCI